MRSESQGAQPLRVVYLTAGAAGMICGSCLHDNTLSRALLALGHDVELIPLYTPIRTDEEDVTGPRIFFGGINTYLQQHVPLFRWLPKWLDRWLDQAWLIEWAAGGSVKIEPQQVADLTVSMLRGHEGNQAKEVERLADWLVGQRPPDVIVLTNILIAGCVPEIKRRLRVPVVVTLQGDDIFLRGLPEPQRTTALAEIRRLAGQIDGYLAHSRYYADAMAEYLGLAREKIQVVPLGVETGDFAGSAERGARSAESRIGERPMTVGYLARLAPEKGLHVLAEAFVALRKMPGTENARLRLAGWLGESNRAYAEEVFGRLRAAGLGDAFEYVGEVDRRGKIEFLSSLDVLSVPTTYREPKGLYVLEALAAGVPVVAPEHGAFPELIAETQGGLMHRPEDPQHLAEQLHRMLTNDELRKQMAAAGRASVQENRNAAAMAERTVEALRNAITSPDASRAVMQADVAGDKLVARK